MQILPFRFPTTPPPVISWSHKWQTGVDLLRLALLRGNTTSSSNDSSAEVSSVTCAVFTSKGSPRASLMVITLALWVESLLSLPASEVSRPMTGRRSLTWRSIPLTRTFCELITSTCKRCTTSFWGLHPDTIAYVISYLLLFGLI